MHAIKSKMKMFSGDLRFGSLLLFSCIVCLIIKNLCCFQSMNTERGRLNYLWYCFGDYGMVQVMCVRVNYIKYSYTYAILINHCISKEGKLSSLEIVK